MPPPTDIFFADEKAFDHATFLLCVPRCGVWCGVVWCPSQGCRADRCRDRGLTHAMKTAVKDKLLSHACLPQLREVASMLDRRFGSLLSPKSSYGGRRLYSEV